MRVEIREKKTNIIHMLQNVTPFRRISEAASASTPTNIRWKTCAWRAHECMSVATGGYYDMISVIW